MKFFVNMITTIRFAYTLILPFIKNKISNIAFILNIVVLFLTDSIDGILARKYKVQTLFGSVMDTVADKTLCIMLLILLINQNKIFLSILLGELIITAINVCANLKGKKTESSKLGKIKMWVISITIVLGYMSNFNIIGNNLIYIATIFSIIMQFITILDYIHTLKAKPSNLDRLNSVKEIKSMKQLKYVLFDTKYYLNMS